MSSNEAEEYKKTTLTGANVPYSPKDPRQEPRDVNSDINRPEINEGTAELDFVYYLVILHLASTRSDCNHF